MLLSLYLAVLDDQSKEEQFIDVYNTYKRLVYHTAYKIMGDSYLAEDVLQEVFLYVAKMLDKTSSIICAFGLAAAAPRPPYRHLELCGIALTLYLLFR